MVDELNRACREHGFFYISHHGISESLQSNLEVQSRRFFELDIQEKMQIAMKKGGIAWRGYFPIGDELTSGRPDQKEGLYFGEELEESHPRVLKKTILHGRNLFPASIPELRQTVLEYIAEMTSLGQKVMRGIALSLGLDMHYFEKNCTYDPLVLFRIFHYPVVELTSETEQLWGVGEHTDYGLLTLLKQDKVGGLQIWSNGAWMEAPYLENTFVCNIGDMLDKMTHGYYVSTPHRVKNTSGQGRLSFPFFFDPSWDAKIRAIQKGDFNEAGTFKRRRWDMKSLSEFHGTYGEYITQKVRKVFPELQ